MTTKQPKIPDSKVTESLGFTTRAVEEIRPSAITPGDGTLHILLTPGQACGIHILNHHLMTDTVGRTDTRAYSVPFISSNPMSLTSFGLGGGTIENADDYARWRVVSQAVRFTLLNVDDEDDGWWEAVRVTEPLNAADWTVQPMGIGNGFNNATLAPQALLTEFQSRNIVNDRSYCTGALRGIHNHNFELHPMGDDHDILPQSDAWRLSSDDVNTSRSIDAETVYGFESGSDDAKNMVKELIDYSYDMIYIRINGRVPSDTSPGVSRLHMNLVSNQEIVFGIGERESRFHTDSPNHPGMDMEVDSKKDTPLAAVLSNPPGRQP
jgi:hypothetical protein